MMALDMKTLCVLEVVSPQRPNLVLTADIPYCEANVLVLDSLHVEACAGENQRKYIEQCVKQLNAHAVLGTTEERFEQRREIAQNQSEI